MRPCNTRSLLLAAVVIINCITWTASRHHHTHNVSGHRSRHRRQGAGLFLSATYVLPGGEGAGWGEWGEVTPCSRTCGGGVASQKRICLQLGPDGQPQCTGGDTKYFSCQTQDCPAGSRDFRSEQCSEFDQQEFRGIRYNWVPYTKAQNPCELNCMPHGERFYYRHKSKVVDGTRCNDESFDVCVNGRCEPVGCDMMLGSSAREDKCRECRGNGANCHTTGGLLDTQDIRKGYNDMLLIPEGATSIVISEIAPSSNYLALKAKNGTYYLNGDYHIDFPRNLDIAGALWNYERSQQGFPAPDKLRCKGPTAEPLILSLLLQDVNVGIEYEYSLPNEAVPPKNQQYNWVHEEFTPCSASCGGGYQTRKVSCRSREELELVDEVLCDEGLKPPTNVSCNTEPCGPQWTPTAWGKCSKNCGKGGTRSRDVHCTQIITNGYPSIIADKSCFDLLGPKPELYQECNENATCPTWFIGHWKPCDKLCDEGKQTRQVVCHQRNGKRVEVLKDEDCEDDKPAVEQTCMLQPCVGVDWVLSEWSGCDSCLSKVQSRTAICVTKDKKAVNDSLCAYHPAPVLEEPCDKSSLPACDEQWYATQWSNCSVECGKGIQTRKVFCGIFDGASVLRVNDSRCANKPKYNDTKTCEIPQDKCPSQWFAGPWSACTKKCGTGEQYRRVMCLRGGKPATDCPENTILDDLQSCNTFPCNTDELIPIDNKASPVMDEDYEDCEEEDYNEVGLDDPSEPSKTTAIDEFMLSDSPSTLEGSGEWSTIPDSTYETEEGSTSTWLTSDEYSSSTTDMGEDGSGTVSESTETYETSASTETSDETSPTESSESTVSGSTESDSTEYSTSDTTESTETGETSSTEETVSTIVSSTESSSDGSSSLLDTASTESTVSESTESTGTDETGSTTETGSTETDVTESGTTETGSSDSSTTESGTTETGTSELSTTESGTTETGTSEGTTESGSTETGTSEGTTESGTSETSVSDGSTTESGTTETGESSTTEGGTSESESTSESGSTEATSESGTTETGITETTESGVTETGTSEGTTEVGTTESESSEGSTTESSTEFSSTSETGSTDGTSETGTTESGPTDLSTTEETGSTESTSESTTESGITESTDVSSTVSSEGGESTTETSEGTTPWDLHTTVEVFTSKKPKVCRPRTCTLSEFGCCPDKKTAALGPFDEGCMKPETCKVSIYGCCPDGLSPAKGPKNQGCPIEPCADTLFGCCESDNKTAAQGNDQEGCPPPPPPCASSKYGCCKDGKTQATGPEKEGCPETTTPEPEETTTKSGEPESPTSTISPPDVDCATSDFGCCADNATAASGPEQQGCPCSSSQFGCCPDGVTEAQGPELAGCVKSCNTSTYGCCSDGKTPAHGPDNQGCCLLYSFGCCIDNYTPARGPHLEGCECQNSRYGCCPDNVTVATGPDNLGCGCQYTEHGCCPNRHDEASGPNFQGCLCHTYQFGCCPDGVTIARGHNGQGCYCQQSEFGCCGDEQTHAKGPNQEGCDCSSSKHGCCPDGTTEATGPKFQGCTDKPENKQAACDLTFERGPCNNYTVNWYFDKVYGGCSRFWYGGCEGNNNRFPSKEECEDNCVSPPPKDACKLPQNKGGCLGYNVRWYYDNEREMCANFIYGGCLGNNNNFETREACQKQCEPERALDQCELEISRGSCAGNYPRWGFNKNTRACEEFIWGGCEGNSNRFRTEAACLHRCNPPGEPQPQCLEPQDVGNCSDTDALWAFSQTENRCLPFYYTGCGGNENKFYSLEDCQQSCPSAFVPELCALPADPGTCYNYREQWYYDTKEQRCQQFYYGGCNGNDNRFDTQQACESSCSAPPTTPAPTPNRPPPQPDQQDVCFMPIDEGQCDSYVQAWAYDYTQGKCVSFRFGGCAGNQNNFRSEEECQGYCSPSQDICQLPMLSGPCNESVMSWFYDAASDSCSQFAYGGCEGNENRFDSREACEERCKSGPATTTTAIVPMTPSECTISADLEECSPQTFGLVWYYHAARSVCLSHDNVAEGRQCRNTGTFYSEEACLRSCGAFRNIDVCRYDVDAGPCQRFVPKYHFNRTSGRCEEFVFGGCVGGPNRFSTEQECHQVCLAQTDPCSQPPEQGNCLGNQVLWYYDQSRDECDRFVYGGCGGNENKFESRESCEGRCRRQQSVVKTTLATPVQTPRQPSDECIAPQSLEPCGSNITAFYFDDATRLCRAAPIGGCPYSNRYSSEEDCLRHCGEFRGLDVCHAPLDPGPCRAYFPKFYFDSVTGLCKSYAYGGCGGGPNRFSTEEECQHICGSEGPAARCLEEVATGVRCSAVPVRRWHYSPARADCLVFAFLGCAGSANNFRSYEECAAVCRVQTDASDSDSSHLCDQYSEECITLESACLHGINVTVAPEGCQRCVCLEPPAVCDQRALECTALRCSYGLQRSVDQDGCEKCECSEDPCLRNSCTEYETCVPAPYTDPDSQETRYTARCEHIYETYTVLPECEVNALECVRLSCSGGVRRTGPRGCERCECIEDTCSGVVCKRDERCVSYSLYDPITRGLQNRSKCVPVNKPGICPPVQPTSDSECRVTCRDDADCRGVGKCCAAGNDCSRHCIYPLPATTTAPPSTTHGPEPQSAPEPSTETEPEVEVSEGGKATLRCIFHGNPPPKITWRFGEITIDGDKDRYRVLSDGALEIVSVYRNDSGVYICIADNGLGISQQEVRLEVSDPVATAAQIAGPGQAVVRGTLGRALELRCPAYGYPAPGIYWYRGADGPMVQYSGTQYEARGQVLTIRRLEPATLGDYLCTAYNGVDGARPVNWLVTVEAYRPDDVVSVTPRPRPSTTSTTIPPPPTMLTPPPYNEGPSAPEASTDTEPEVAVSEGGKATLRCIFHGNPPPRIIWTFGEITIDGDKDRYRLLSDGALEIVSVYRNDSGVYICIADNELGTSRQEVNLQVTDPVATAAQIAGPGQAVVRGTLGRALELRCPAYGYPAPGIYWYRGADGPMVQYSGTQYEARGQVLTIRRLEPATLGDYLCTAYNGVDGARPVNWLVTVEGYSPDEPLPPPPRPTESIPDYPRPDYEPVWTRVQPVATNVSTGSEVVLPCEIRGYPAPSVRWTKDGQDLLPGERIWVTDSRVTIRHATREDSGEYACEAVNKYSDYRSAVTINVQDVYIPAKCVDNPTFANCNLIVQSRFCNHKYYSRFCCKSCVEAGQLDPRDVEMQGDEPYRKK